ncbi:hypothetical protein [Sporosarcina sp. FSL W7-1283]|uniref:hypothetical protein n=1 Tax=Sporosarcina sp. FSL W7-1283 TaxID=2921560 RepID=UPI0030F6B27E
MDRSTGALIIGIADRDWLIMMKVMGLDTLSLSQDMLDKMRECFEHGHACGGTAMVDALRDVMENDISLLEDLFYPDDDIK